MTKAKQLGTVLPTSQSLSVGDAHSERLDVERRNVGGEIPDTTERVIGGEYRYYLTDGIRYAVVSRALRILWFKHTDNGDFPIPSPIERP